MRSSGGLHRTCLGVLVSATGTVRRPQNRNGASNGTDVIGFSLVGEASQRTSCYRESKAGFRPTTTNRLQQAINDSGSLVREAMSLSAIKQRLLGQPRRCTEGWPLPEQGGSRLGG